MVSPAHSQMVVSPPTGSVEPTRGTTRMPFLSTGYRPQMDEPEGLLEPLLKALPESERTQMVDAIKENHAQQLDQMTAPHPRR